MKLKEKYFKKILLPLRMKFVFINLI